MSVIAIGRSLRRRRGHLALLAAVAALAGALAAHHGGVAVGDTQYGDHGSTVTATVETMCLAAFTVVGAAVVAIAIGLIALGRRSRATLLSRAARASGPSRADAGVEKGSPGVPAHVMGMDDDTALLAVGRTARP